MIYLGNGLYSDSGNSLMHAGQRRNLGIDWNNPAQVREYYKEYYAMRNKGNGRIPSYNVPQANRAVAIGNAAKNASNTASQLLEGVQLIRRESREDREGDKIYTDRNGKRRRPNAHDFSELRRENGIPLARRPGGSFVTPRSPRDVKNRADTIKQPNGGFVTPRPNNTSGRAKADTEKSPSGGFVAPRSSAERRAADDRARSPRGGFMAPRPGYVTRDQDDKKRSPKGGPHFATKEYQQEQANKRARTKSIRAFGSAQTAQISQKGHGTLAEANYNGGLTQKRDTRRGSGLYDSRGQMRYAAHRTTEATRAGVEAGRRRHRGDAGNRGYQTTSSQSDQGVNYDAGLKAARERARNAKNAKNGVESKSAHNQAVKGQENRGSGTLADFNYQKKMDNNEKRKVADYKRGNKNSYFDLDLGKRNTERGIAAGRNRAKIKQAEDAFNKKLAADKQAKKDKQRETASMPYKAFKEGSERIVGSAYDAYKKGKKKLKKFFG